MLEDLHEPLPRGDELERAVALLEELHRVLDRLGLRHERGEPLAGRAAPGIAQELDDRLLRLLDRLARQLGVGRVGLARVEAREGVAAELDGGEVPVAPHHLAQGEALLAPPLHVGRVAEGADHEDPGALLAVDELAREDRHRDPEERGHRPLAEERPVALVLGVRRHPDAGRQQLRAGGGDDEGAPALDPEAHVVEGALLRAVLHLGLRHRGPEVDVPEGGRLDLVDLALAVEVEEAPLRGPAARLADRRVLERPVHGEAEPLPQVLERLLVLGGEREAQLDEVRPRDAARRLLARRVVRHRDLQPGLVRGVRLAAHVVVVLDAALRGQAVVVPAHRVEDVSPAHPLVAGEDVGLRVAEHVPHVERARDGGRRRVDDVGRSRGPARRTGGCPTRASVRSQLSSAAFGSKWLLRVLGSMVMINVDNLLSRGGRGVGRRRATVRPRSARGHGGVAPDGEAPARLRSSAARP